jgi:hypothetical protein
MSCSESNLVATQKLLREMASEARELQAAAGGSVTDGVAGWLSSQYAAAAHEKLSAAQGSQRWEVLRAFAQDWAMLRHGDHMAERLRIERERLKLAKRDIEEKWRIDEEKALAVCLDETKKFPEVVKLFRSAFEALKIASRPGKKKEFREWMRRPENQKEIFPELTCGLSPETLKKIEQELRLL